MSLYLLGARSLDLVRKVLMRLAARRPQNPLRFGVRCRLSTALTALSSGRIFSLGLFLSDGAHGVPWPMTWLVLVKFDSRLR